VPIQLENGSPFAFVGYETRGKILSSVFLQGLDM